MERLPLVGADALKHLETGDSDPYLFLPRSGSFFDENMLLPSPQSDVYISPCLLELHSSRLRMLLMWLRAHKKKRDAYANEEYAQCAPGPRVRAIRGASTDDEHVGNHEQQSRNVRAPHRAASDCQLTGFWRTAPPSRDPKNINIGLPIYWDR